MGREVSFLILFTLLDQVANVYIDGYISFPDFDNFADSGEESPSVKP
jgi:hypothetical protein